MNDSELVFISVGIKNLQGDEPIYATRNEIEAIDRLALVPEETIPINVDWNSVKSRLNVASNETEENKKWWKDRQK